MPKPQRFRVRLQDAGGGGAAFGLPARAAAALGERKRPPVTVTIRDHTFRTAVNEPGPSGRGSERQRVDSPSGRLRSSKSGNR
ncbi:MAG: DUF1905 domain-containing protein [Acidimicrobiales bacterium]